MSGSDSTICLDSCVYLAKYNGESDKPLQAIDGLIKSIVEGESTLVVSTIHLAEVLSGPENAAAGEIFRGFIKRRNVIVANVDPRVAQYAAKMRHQQREAKQKVVKVPDSLILSTAVLYKAAELYTFDPVLLSLNGTCHAGKCRIIRPGDLADLPLFAKFASSASQP